MLVRRLLPGDAGEFRRMRLDGLVECPDAFGAAFADEATLPLSHFSDILENAYVVGGFRTAS